MTRWDTPSHASTSVPSDSSSGGVVPSRSRFTNTRPRQVSTFTGANAERIAVDFGAEVAGRAQPPVERVRPSVVPAHETRDPSPSVVDERSGPMAAHVVVGAQAIVVVDDDQDVPARDRDGEVVAVLGQRRCKPREQPLAPEHGAPFTLVDQRVAVPRRGQRRRHPPRGYERTGLGVCKARRSCGSSSTGQAPSGE